MISAWIKHIYFSSFAFIWLLFGFFFFQKIYFIRLVAFSLKCRFWEYVNFHGRGLQLKADIIKWLCVNFTKSRQLNQVPKVHWNQNHCKNLEKKTHTKHSQNEKEVFVLKRKSVCYNRILSRRAAFLFFGYKKGETFNFIWISTMTSAYRNYYIVLLHCVECVSEWEGTALTLNVFVNDTNTNTIRMFT